MSVARTSNFPEQAWFCVIWLLSFCPIDSSSLVCGRNFSPDTFRMYSRGRCNTTSEFWTMQDLYMILFVCFAWLFFQERDLNFSEDFLST